MNSNSISRQDSAHRQNEEIVYLVDDRPSDLLLVRRLCESVGIAVKVYDNPVTFLADVDKYACGCLIVDLLMPDMSGLQLFNHLAKRRIQLTTVIITGFADATSCRTGFRSGVFDFIEKDFSPDELLSVIRRALEHNRSVVRVQRMREERCNRVEELTQREMDVARLLNEGNALKEIGARLGISVQTASKHRTSIFGKLSVTNEVELHQSFADCLATAEPME
ncbi:MAG: response regulator [Planctomycetales bacterium]|nr:response regulator [Planctomycetales bacterium]